MSKVAVINIWSAFLLAMAVLVAAGSQTNASTKGNQENKGSTVQSMCESTDYKQTCKNSLKSTNSDDPKEVIKTGFQAAITELKHVISSSDTVKQAANDPRSKQALDACKEVMENAIDDLQRSFDELGAFDVGKLDLYIQNLEVWLGGAISYEQTCLDAFENTTGDAGKKMQDLMNTTMELTSNALALVSQISNITHNVNLKDLAKSLGYSNSSDKGKDGSHRRLLSADGFPSWMTAGQRMILGAPPGKLKANAVVAQDGSGQFKTINEALKKVKLKSNETFVIQIKAGVYKEQVEVAKGMNNVVFIGDGPTKTKITGSKSFADGITTFKTATVAVVGDGFIAKDIGFENSAGAIKHQAVALRVNSDLSVFHNCQMDGFQDTLYAHTHRQFYRDCIISGTVDFIFGDSSCVFQNCKLIVRKPMDNQKCMVTAQGRKEERQVSGIVIQNCSIVGDAGFVPTKNTQAFLGRPWKKFSRTIVMRSFIDKIIDPAGWSEWQGNFALDTLYYAEFENRGPGANQAQRVKWKGLRKINAATAASFTPAKFLEGNTWIPKTGVPYKADL